MATLTVQTVSRAGFNVTTPGFVACASGGDKFANSGKELALFNNASGSAITVTLAFNNASTQALVDGQTPASRTVSIPANTIMAIGPYKTALYSDSSGFMNFTYSAVTSLSVCILLVNQGT